MPGPPTPFSVHALQGRADELPLKNRRTSNRTKLTVQRSDAGRPTQREKQKRTHGDRNEKTSTSKQHGTEENMWWLGFLRCRPEALRQTAGRHVVAGRASCAPLPTMLAPICIRLNPQAPETHTLATAATAVAPGSTVSCDQYYQTPSTGVPPSYQYDNQTTPEETAHGASRVFRFRLFIHVGLSPFLNSLAICWIRRRAAKIQNTHRYPPPPAPCGNVVNQCKGTRAGTSAYGRRRFGASSQCLVPASWFVPCLRTSACDTQRHTMQN